MQKTILIISIIAISFLYVREINAEKTVDSIMVSRDNTSLVLWGLSRYDFDIKYDKDTILIESKSYVDIDELQIQFLTGEPTKNVLAGEIIYGVYQYLTDDMGTRPLNYSYNEAFRIGKTDGKYAVRQIININIDRDSLIGNMSFQEIKKESYAFQRNFYQDLISKDIRGYKKCCPEYIKQSEDFLAKRESDFKTIKDLSLGIFYKKVIINLGNGKYLVFNDSGEYR